MIGLRDDGGDSESGGDAAQTERLSARLETVARYLEKIQISDYLDLVADTKRMIMINFVAGLARGVGMAVGFSILGALVIYFLTRSFLANLPIVGGLIAQIVGIVQTQLTR